MADEPWYLIADMPATSHARERSQLIWRGDRALNETDPGTLARIVDILEFLARSAVPVRSVASSPEHQTPAKTGPWRQSAPLVAGRWPLPALTARTVAAFAASLRFWYPINHVGDVRARHAMARPHQGIAQRVPADERDAHSATVTEIDTQLIRRKPVLSGLINEYAHTA